MGAADNGSFTVGLYSNSSNAPSTFLLTIASEGDSSLSIAAAVYDFPVADYALSANTQYWIGLIPNSPPINAKWGGVHVTCGDTGTATQSIDLGGTVFPSNTNFAFYMSVDAVPLQQTGTPEPSSGLLLAAAACLRHRFRSRMHSPSGAACLRSEPAPAKARAKFPPKAASGDRSASY